ncbi:hypothetical protein FLP15_04885 [Lactococcus protaetiae]|uniref:Uncharacterized protein n=2 Tax=Lactococcus protaetiae TaxID=2592653 RepID=A0A514Z7Z9_9LACT|nr:hypothetical protein FLP15_04885 [Lactococcus protaetiae]
MKKDKMEPALRADLRDLVAPLSVCLGAELQEQKATTFFYLRAFSTTLSIGLPFGVAALAAYS